MKSFTHGRASHKRGGHGEEVLLVVVRGCVWLVCDLVWLVGWLVVSFDSAAPRSSIERAGLTEKQK